MSVARAFALILMGSATAVIAANPAAESKFEAGHTVFEQHCVVCHGVNGDGNGPAASWLFPRPRNFGAGYFKIKTTPGMTLPTDADLFRTLTRGMPGSSMPSFAHLTEQQRHDVVQYVKYLSAYTQNDQRINHFEQAAREGRLGNPISIPPEPVSTAATAELGQMLYSKAGCMMCHGLTGAGDGPLSSILKDAEGFPLRPRDLSHGEFRGGAEATNLYARIYTGLAGTPMPPYGDTLMQADERWAVVQYVQSLQRKNADDIHEPADRTIHAAQVQRVPIDPMDPVWKNIAAVRVPVNSIDPLSDGLKAVTVSAVHDGKKIALLCQWRSAIANGAPVRVQDFQDAVALLFSMDGKTPTVGAASAKTRMNIWKWNTGRQTAPVDQSPDVRDLYASMHMDAYRNTNSIDRTAKPAERIAARFQKFAVEDGNARGFGPITAQRTESQNVDGKGAWHDGVWSVVFVRGLRSKDSDDVKLRIKKSVPVIFSVWNGAHERKVTSDWFKLTLTTDE